MKIPVLFAIILVAAATKVCVNIGTPPPAVTEPVVVTLPTEIPADLREPGLLSGRIKPNEQSVLTSRVGEWVRNEIVGEYYYSVVWAKNGRIIHEENFRPLTCYPIEGKGFALAFVREEEGNWYYYFTPCGQ